MSRSPCVDALAALPNLPFKLQTSMNVFFHERKENPRVKRDLLSSCPRGPFKDLSCVL